MIDFVRDKCGVKSGNVRDIQILDKFSFLTLSFHDAEILLSHFKKRKSGQGTLFSKVRKTRK
jgi:ATP-dependent RNA helicase DeaD